MQTNQSRRSATCPTILVAIHRNRGRSEGSPSVLFAAGETVWTDRAAGPRGLAQRRILDLAAPIVVHERAALGSEDRRNGLDPQRNRDHDRPMNKVKG
jgi:hypothetical protein